MEAKKLKIVYVISVGQGLLEGVEGAMEPVRELGWDFCPLGQQLIVAI